MSEQQNTDNNNLEEIDKKIARLMSQNTKNNNKENNNSSALKIALSGGLEITVATLLGFYLGYLLDKYFDTTPIFIIIFSLVGLIAGFINLYRHIMKNLN